MAEQRRVGESGPTEERERLIARLFASRHFAGAEALRRVLRFLVDHVDRTGAAPKEYDIAVGALGRPASFDPKADPIVRVDIAQIRARLQAYFDTDGRHETLRLIVPRGQYRPVFSEADAPPAVERPETPGLARFWAPYLHSDAESILVFSEMLFLRDEAGTFVRNIYVNERGTAREQLQARTGIQASGLKPSYHFVSAGEMHALLALIRVFVAAGARFETRNARFSSWAALSRANLILLGSSRTNTFLDALQSGEDFVIATDHIENRRPRDAEQAVYRGTRRADGKLEKVTEYAVVTRRPGMTPGMAVTSVAANHGRAIEGAAEFISSEDRVQSLLAALHPDSAGPLPGHFQLLLRIEMIDFDDEVVEVACVAHRLDAPASAAGTETAAQHYG